MTTLQEIGAQLREERLRRKLYKVKLAEASGVHRNTVSDLESGSGNVELNTLIALCDQLGLDIHLVAKPGAGFEEQDLPRLQESGDTT